MNSSLQKGNKAFMAASFVINSVLDTLDDEARSYLHVAKSQAEAARDEALITTSKFAFRNRDARRYEKLAKRYLVVAHELSARRQHRQPIAVEDYDDDDCLSVYSLEDDNDFSRPPVPSRSPSPYPPPPPYQTRQASPPTFSRPSSPQSTGSVGSSSSYATSHAAPPTYGYTTHPHHYPHAGQPGLVRAKMAASAPPPASAHGVPAQYQYAYQASYAGSYVVPMPAAGVAAVYPQYAYYPVIVPARQMA